MSKLHIILSFILLTLNSPLVFSQAKLSQEKTTELVNKNEFTFHATRANPMNFDVIRVMNSIPNSGAARILELNDPNYLIEIKNDKIEVILPYFGRVFNASYGDSDKNSYRFTSKDFTIKKEQNKKGKWTINILPKDVDHVSNIILEVFKNGKTYVSFKSDDRQPITYDGYITTNEIN